MVTRFTPPPSTASVPGASPAQPSANTHSPLTPAAHRSDAPAAAAHGDDTEHPISESRALQQQMAALLGESLFGAWLDPQQELAPASMRKRRSWWRLATLAMLLVGIAVAATLFVRRGLDRRALEQRARLVHDLGAFLQDGDLERTAHFLALVQNGHPAIDPADPHVNLLVRAEATVYRYYDAEPNRRKRLEPLLTSMAAGSPHRTLAMFTLASRAERAAHVSTLESLPSAFVRDPEPFYLLATAYEQRREIDPARTAWQRAADLGPMWLGHRFEEAAFERRQGKEDAATKTASQMVRTAPESAWATLAASSFAIPVPVLSAASSNTAPPPPPPVQVHRQHLVDAIEAARRNDLSTARRRLSTAIDAVHGEPPFVLDTFDWLVDEGVPALARELTALEAWPATSPIAKASVARLEELAATTAAARSANEGPAQAKPKSGSPKTKTKPPAKKHPRGKGRP